MGNRIIWIIFIVAFQSTAVLGRNQYHDYFYSRYHHKSHSTTTAISSTVSEYFSEVKTESSVSDDSIENIKYSSTDDFSIENVNLSSTAGFVPSHQRNGTVHSYEYDYDYDPQYGFRVKLGIIVGCASVFLVCSCCLFCCIRICRRRNAVRSGFIIADRPQIAQAAAHPQQPVLSQPPVIGHQYPPQYRDQPAQSFPPQYQEQQSQLLPPQYQDERARLFPPQYQTQITQQQYPPVQNYYQTQCSPTASQCSPTAPPDHNQPEAPPPYDFPEKF